MDQTSRREQSIISRMDQSSRREQSVISRMDQASRREQSIISRMDQSSRREQSVTICMWLEHKRQIVNSIDFSGMITIYVAIMYDQIVKGTIIKTLKVERGV